MISFEDALAIVLAHVQPLGTELRPLAECRAGVIAEDIRAPFDLPCFDQSAVDGFAVMVEDVRDATLERPVSLTLVGTIRAGDIGDLTLSRGTTLKIMTGALVPPTVEAVVMKEYALESGGCIQIQRAAKRGENIRRAGEEFKAGDIALRRGTWISPPVVGLLASCGLNKVKVYHAPKVSLILTGSELISPGQSLRPGQIYDSNRYSLHAACAGLGLNSITVQHVRDELDALAAILREALASSDIVVTVGGASVGDYDFVQEALRALKVKLHFTKVAIKPGKPTMFGTAEEGSKPVFALPGNPVPALLIFYLLVRPALLALMGAPSGPRPMVRAVLSRELKKKPGRLEFVRVRLERRDSEMLAIPTGGQESHMLGGLACADGLLRFAADAEWLAAGSLVDVELLPWSV